MAKIRISFVHSFFLLLIIALAVAAQERELLYSKSASSELQEITATIRNLKSAVTSGNQLTRKTDYFVRIAPRKYVVMADGKLQQGARLGGKPFVFMTTPESAYGLSLLDIYAGIGYEAEDIIRWQRDEDMVMIVFRYPPEVAIVNVTNGHLPADWNTKVITPTWKNIFSLFHLLATRRPVAQQSPPERTLILKDNERDFVRRFSSKRKQRIARTAYAVLKAQGGPNWKYRNLLEQRLSVFEHFRGDGKTQNELLDPDGTGPGLLEFVGPNWNLNQLPEVAIIHLGKLTMKDSYGGGCSFCRPGK